MGRKIIAAGILTLFLVSSGVYVDAGFKGYISTWNDSSSIINVWKDARDSNLSLTVYPLCESGFTVFDGYKITARDQWNMFEYVAGTSTNYDIAFVGGTYAYIQAIYAQMPQGIPGRTTRYFTTQADDYYYYLYSGSPQRKDAKYLASAFCYIIDDFAYGTAQVQCTMLHEFGHGVGWDLHSATSSDVMYANNNQVTTLTSGDKTHISQFYE